MDGAGSRALSAALIGVPMDLGGNRRGVDMGPSALRVARVSEGLLRLGCDVVDRGDVAVPTVETLSAGEEHARFVSTISAVCADLRGHVREACAAGRVPITLGGDHSVAMGSVAGVADHYRKGGTQIGLLWVDAHGDMNTPTSTMSGNVHGMPLSYLLGLWAPPGEQREAKIHAQRTCLIGIRDLDDRERDLIARSAVSVFTMKDIDRDGMAATMDKALRIVSSGTTGFHVSFDVDVVDPSLAPGVGTPRRGGLNYREAHLLMELVADSRSLVGLDIVEVNPVLDVRNQTADLAAELVLSALGKRIF